MVRFRGLFHPRAALPALGRQTVFYAVTLPLMDLGLAAGMLSGAMFTNGLMSLGQFWLFASACAVLPVLPFLAWRGRVTDR